MVNSTIRVIAYYYLWYLYDYVVVSSTISWETIMSCERTRTAAYSSDICWRILYQIIGLGKGYNDTASHLNVDSLTVHRIIACFEQTGDVSKSKCPPNAGVTKLTYIRKYFILDLVIDKPGIYLREIQEELFQATGIDISEGRICHYLEECEFTRQKMAVTASQRNDLLRVLSLLMKWDQINETKSVNLPSA